MRTLAPVSSELQLELGLDLDLNTEDVAAAEAAVAAHIDESLMCSCCTQILTDKVSLHLHQISRHSVSELSLALLSVRGLDVKSGLDVIEQQDLCCEDNDSDSTASAHSAFMCGFTDDFRSNSSHNMVGDVGVSSPSELDKKFNNNSISYASQFSLDNARKTSLEPSMNGSQQPDTGHQHAYRDVARQMHQNPPAITVLSNRKGKNRPKRVKPNNLKKTNVFSTQVKDEVIDLTATSKTVPRDAKPTSRVNKECKNAAEVEERKFPCDVCGRRYKKKSHLGRHARMHSGVRPFPCTVCDKRFAVRSILKQHLRVHTGERPFKCPYCLQRFPQKSGLVTHMMLHTGKPYKCDCCAKSFVSNHKLVVHKRAHDEQSGRLPSLGPYACPTCATRFFTSSALWEHVKVHASSPTTAKSSDKVSVVAPAECSVADHLTGTLEFTQDISPERDDGKKSLENVNGDSRRRMGDLDTHNSQEVTAGQALLTLMDSNSECHDRNEDHSQDSEGDFGDDQLGSHEFEFCDLKSSIELKEECFDFENEDFDGQSNCGESENKVQMVVS